MGEGQPDRAKKAAKVGVSIAMGTLSVWIGFVWIMRSYVIRIYTHQSEVSEVASRLFWLAGAVGFFDAFQNVS